MRALNSAVTGLQAHQTRMDVIGNNIANVNTVGYKSSRVTFQDVFSQTVSAGSATTNPKQVGLGVAVGSTDLDMTAGSTQLTGRDLDLSIEGDGMFVLRQSDGTLVYTRAGSFDWSADGVLVNPATGDRVQGYEVDDSGQVSGVLGDIVLLKGTTVPAQATTRATLVGNLDPISDTGSTASTSVIVYDSLGRPHSVTLNFERQDATSWDVTAVDSEGQELEDGTTTLHFDETGTIDEDDSTWTLQLALDDTDDVEFTLDLSGIRIGYTGTETSTVSVQSSDGAPLGTLESVSISSDGEVIGVYSNGNRVVHARIALANFTNPAGLAKAGDSTFTETRASGPAMVGLPNTGGRGRLESGSLESSNVDLSSEFTNMILTQRGFQANARVVSTADDMLQELVNLRR